MFLVIIFIEEFVLNWQLSNTVTGKITYISEHTYLGGALVFFLCNTLLSQWYVFHDGFGKECCILQGLLYSLGTII
jgi:hypothetical protein